MYQSGTYWKFIGLGQLIAGFLLMTQRYAKLGALICFPIITNILVITLSYYFAFTPALVGFMFLANIGLLVWEWNELKTLFNLPFVQNRKGIEHHTVWEVIGYILFGFTFVYKLFVDRYDAVFWFSICFIIGLIGLLAGIKLSKKYVSKNYK